MCTLNDITGFKGYTILGWNTRSLLPRIEEVECIIEKADPEIFAICESWLTDKISTSQVDISGYKFIRSDRTANSGKHGGGGVACYYKDKITCTHLPELNICTTYIECLWLKLTLVNTRAIYYGIIYRPPSGNVVDFINKLEEICLLLRSKSNCEINFLGDINLNLHRKRDPNVRRYTESLRRMGFKQLINEATHVGERVNSYSLIDHYVTSNDDLYGKHGVVVHGATDHFVIYTVRKKDKPDHPKGWYTGRAYSKMDK